MITHARTNTILLVLTVVIGLATLATVARWAAAGPLDPPGAPAPTLPQVEPRSPIPPVGWDGSLPITITAAGSYFLTRDLTLFFPTNNAIAVNARRCYDRPQRLLRHRCGDRHVERNHYAGRRRPHHHRKRHCAQAGMSASRRPALTRMRVQNVTAQLNKTQGVDVGSGSIVSHVMAVGNPETASYIADPHSKFEGGLIEDSVATRNLYGIVRRSQQRHDHAKRHRQ